MEQWCTGPAHTTSWRLSAVLRHCAQTNSTVPDTLSTWLVVSGDLGIQITYGTGDEARAQRVLDSEKGLLSLGHAVLADPSRFSNHTSLQSAMRARAPYAFGLQGGHGMNCLVLYKSSDGVRSAVQLPDRIRGCRL